MAIRGIQSRKKHHTKNQASGGQMPGSHSTRRVAPAVHYSFVVRFVWLLGRLLDRTSIETMRNPRLNLIRFRGTAPGFVQVCTRTRVTAACGSAAGTTSVGIRVLHLGTVFGRELQRKKTRKRREIYRGVKRYYRCFTAVGYSSIKLLLFKCTR
jgi:hypothetical protein